MSHLQQIKDWRSPTATSGVYEKLLGAMGSDEFGTVARDSVTSVTGGIRRLYLFEAKGHGTSDLRYFSGEPGIAELIPLYAKCYLALDPVNEAFRAAPLLRDMALLQVRPSDIAAPGYRRRYFDEAGIVERVSIIQRGADAWRVMNVARHQSDGLFCDDELSSLVSLACLILPMMAMNRAGQRGHPLTVEQLEERFERRHGELTPRERQVCARAAIGMTVEATALDLEIAKTSVLTYRKRAYQRLNISSPYELGSLITH